MNEVLLSIAIAVIGLVLLSAWVAGSKRIKNPADVVTFILLVVVFLGSVAVTLIAFQ